MIVSAHYPRSELFEFLSYKRQEPVEHTRDDFQTPYAHQVVLFDPGRVLGVVEGGLPQKVCGLL